MRKGGGLWGWGSQPISLAGGGVYAPPPYYIGTHNDMFEDLFLDAVIHMSTDSPLHWWCKNKSVIIYSLRY